MTKPRRLKCRYCDWSTLAWFKSKNGRSHSGMTRLVEHVHDKHTTTDRLREIAADEHLAVDTYGWDAE